jgi:hypothetical protein
VVAITAAAIVLDTPRIVPVLLATARDILATVVRRLIVLLLRLFLRVRAIARAIVLPLPLFLRARAIARTPQVVV